jgi:hypothetical protein
MSSFGVTLEGFNQKTLETILDEIVADERAVFGPSINTQADSVFGQLNGIVADQIAEQWEVQQEIYRSFQPDFATGEALVEIGAITGTVPLPQLPSTVLLELNLDPGATVIAGKLVGIGAAGEQWTIDVGVTNAGAAETTIIAAATSVNLGQIIGNPGTINTIITPVVGWSSQAAINSTTSEPYTLANGQTLFISVDGAADQTATFLTGDFVDITNATAAEIASVISLAITGATSIDSTGVVRISSDLDGAGSAIQINGGTAFEGIGISRAEIIGFNNDKPAITISGNSQTYALVDAQTLSVRIDGGVVQTATFNTGDFVDISNATAVEVARVITADITGAVAYVTATRLTIESLTVGVNSQIAITGGAANSILNFVETAFNGVSGAATLGRELETDEEFRLRREALLRITGKGTLEAIRAALLDVDLVQQAFVFENDTNAVDVNGLPPHSFEAVVFAGDDVDIAQSIFDTKPIGIQTHRDPGPDGRTEAIVDSQGTSHDINFSRPTQIQMFIEADITVDTATFGGGDAIAGVEQVKQALKAEGDTLQIGDDVVILRFGCAPLVVTGVVDVTLMQVEDIFPPTNTANIVIPPRDIATFSTADMVINVTFV